MNESALKPSAVLTAGSAVHGAVGYWCLMLTAREVVDVPVVDQLVCSGKNEKQSERKWRRENCVCTAGEK